VLSTSPMDSPGASRELLPAQRFLHFLEAHRGPREPLLYVQTHYWLGLDFAQAALPKRHLLRRSVEQARSQVLVRPFLRQLFGAVNGRTAVRRFGERARSRNRTL